MHFMLEYICYNDKYKLMTSLCTLVCDTRENAVTRHTDELSQITLARAQMTTGDYSVNSPTGQILVIIERKSLADYGASFKDGRHDNKNKLIDLRAITGCRIMYIIEGPAFPDPRDTFSRIAYANIESSIFHLMIADGITILRTQDTLDTARTLVRFVRSMDTLYNRVGDTMLNDVKPATTQPTDIDAIELLTARKTPSDAEVARKMWSCFPGITVETASEYMRHWSVADIVRRRISIDAISKFKTANGRTITTKAYQGLTNIDKRLEIRLLSVVPGISTVIATTLLEKTSLSALLSYGSEMYMEVISRDRSGVAKRRLGDKLAAAIVKHFNYRTPQLVTDAVTIDTVITPVVVPVVTPVVSPTDIPVETLGSIDEFLSSLG